MVDVIMKFFEADVWFTQSEQLSLEGTSADSLGQPSRPKQGHLEKVAQHLAGRVFCITKDGGSRTAMANTFQCSATLTNK